MKSQRPNENGLDNKQQTSKMISGTIALSIIKNSNACSEKQVHTVLL